MEPCSLMRGMDPAHATTSMTLKYTLSERSRVQEASYCAIPFMSNSRKCKVTYSNGKSELWRVVGVGGNGLHRGTRKLSMVMEMFCDALHLGCGRGFVGACICRNERNCTLFYSSRFCIHYSTKPRARYSSGV